MAEYVYAPVVAACLGAFKALGLRLNVQGSENVPASGGAVIASNHVSHVDFIFSGLGAHQAGRWVRFMAKESVFSHPVSGPLMRGMKHIPVDRDAGAASYKASMKALRAGECVGLFPEATISRSFELKEFKTGAVRLAQVGKSPLIPVALWGTQRLATYDKRASLRQRGVPVSVYVGDPIEPGRDSEAATAALHVAISALLDRARSEYPDDGTGQWWQPVRLGGTAPTPAEAAVIEEEARLRREAHEARRRVHDQQRPAGATQRRWSATMQRVRERLGDRVGRGGRGTGA